MKGNILIKTLFKSLGFVCAVHLLSILNMMLCHHEIIGNTIWLGLQLLICVASIPVYFFCRGDHTWKYTALTIGTHLISTTLSCLILSCIFSGWDTLIVYWTEISLAISFGVILLVEIFANLKA